MVCKYICKFNKSDSAKEKKENIQNNVKFEEEKLNDNNKEEQKIQKQELEGEYQRLKNQNNEVDPKKNELQFEADYQRLKNQNEVVVNPKKLDRVLNHLKATIEELLGPNPPRIGLIHMFEISGKNTKNWEIKLPNGGEDSEGQYGSCFYPKKLIEALHVIQAFFIWKFNDRIQKIEVHPEYSKS